MKHVIHALITIAPMVLVSATAVAQYDRDPAECAAMSTSDVEVVPYTVVQGDSCARIARRQYGDRSRYDLIHAYNTGMGPEPHRHVPGRTLCLPRVAPPRGSGPIARVTALRQRVRQRPAAVERWEPAELDQAIDRGHRVNTLERAFAELTFRDTTVVTLRGDTIVVVYGATDGTVRRTATEAVLERGALRSRLGMLRAGHRLDVRTPTSRILLEGGSAVASVDPEATTRVSNHEGGAARLSDSSGRGAVRVRPGMGSRVARGGRPTPPQPLPDAPTWVAGPSRFVGVAQLTSVAASWQPVAGARSYRVEIARRPDGRDLVAQLEVPASVRSFSMHRLPPGVYYARLATIDGDLFESRPSAPWSFEVVLGALLEPGADEPAEFDFGDPIEEVARLAVLPGARLTPPEGVRCALGEELTPTDSLVLEDAGVYVLACSDADGPVGAFAVEVAEVGLTVAGAGGAELVRGTEATLELDLDSAVELPEELHFEGTEGLEVLGWERRGDSLLLRVRSAEAAPDRGTLRVSIGRGARPLASLDVSVSSAPPLAAAVPVDAEPEEAEAGSPGPEVGWPQTLGVALSPSVIGLRDGSREGLGAWTSGAYSVSPDDPSAQHLRGAAGARAGLLGGPLQLELAIAGDIGGDYDRTSRRGAGDLYGAAAYAPRWGDARFVFELGAFLPTNPGDGGLGVVRLVPTIAAQLELDARLLLRTRQGAFVDLSGLGNAAWVSAYGVDVRVLGPLVLGAELDLTLGQEDGELLLLPYAGASLAIAEGPVVLGLAGRFALTGDAQRALAPVTVLVTIEGHLSLEPGR